MMSNERSNDEDGLKSACHAEDESEVKDILNKPARLSVDPLIQSILVTKHDGVIMNLLLSYVEGKKMQGEMLCSAAGMGCLQVIILGLKREWNISCEHNHIQAIHVAAEKGQEEVVMYLLEKGASVNTTTSDTRLQPLHMACRKGHKGMVELLLRSGADVSAFGKGGETPFMCAVSGGEVDIVKTIIGAKGITRCSFIPLLNDTVRVGNPEMIQLLLGLVHSDLSIELAAKLAISRGNPKVVKCFLEKGITLDDSVLCIAARNNSEEGLEILQMLIDKGVQVSKTVALYFAVNHANVKVVDLLLQHGAPVCYSFSKYAVF